NNQDTNPIRLPSLVIGFFHSKPDLPNQLASCKETHPYAIVFIRNPCRAGRVLFSRNRNQAVIAEYRLFPIVVNVLCTELEQIAIQAIIEHFFISEILSFRRKW